MNSLNAINVFDSYLLGEGLESQSLEPNILETKDSFFTDELKKLIFQSINSTNLVNQDLSSLSLDEIAKNLKIETLDEKSVLILGRIFSSCKAVKGMQKMACSENNLLSDQDILKICTVAEIALEDPNFRACSSHISKKIEGLKHSVVVDFDRNSFTILLKDSGKIMTEGQSGKVRSIIKVSNSDLSRTIQTARHFAQKSPKFPNVISDEEIKWSKKYQRGTHELTYQNGKEKVKKTLVAEAYDCNLLDMLKNTTQVDEGEILDILKQIADQISGIHGDDNVHSDLKLPNVLYRNESGKIRIQISDFGLVNLKNFMYGTPAFSSPQILLKLIKGNPVEVDKKDDMYAIGMMLYLLLFKSTPSWCNLIGKAMKCTEQSKGKDILINSYNQQRQIGKFLDLLKQNERSEVREQLIDILKGLLDGNDKTRMTAEDLRIILASISQEMNLQLEKANAIGDLANLGGKSPLTRSV